MLKDRVRHNNVCQDVTILNQIDLIKCKVVVHDEYFVDRLAHDNIVITAHLAICGLLHDAVRLVAGRGSQAEFKTAVGIGLAKWATLMATWDIFALVLLIQHFDYLSAR